jgi:aspartate/methionine/tyrosine aminotransferase
MLSRRASDQVPVSAYDIVWEVMNDSWDAHENPQGHINVGVAENRLMQAELEEYLTRVVNLRGSVLTYEDGPIGSHRLRTALARFLNRHLSPCRPLDPCHIIVTNGVTNALEHVSWAFANGGDDFLLGRPFYGAVNLMQRAQVRTWPVTFGQADPFSLVAVGCYEAAIQSARKQGVAIRGLLLCSPHNPLGQCYPRHVLTAFLTLCSKYKIHLISDEIYALSTWKDPPFCSVLSLDIDELIDPSLVHVLWGVSKDFGANGWRVGCIISPSNHDLHAALKSVAIYSYVSSITDHIVAQVLEDDIFTEAYISENRRRLATMHTFASEFLRLHDIPYQTGTNAAFFLWVDLGQAYSDRHPGRVATRDIADEVKQALWLQKVYVAYGGNFGSESPGMFRIVFSHPQNYLEEALRRIHRAVEFGVKSMTPAIQVL